MKWAAPLLFGSVGLTALIAGIVWGTKKVFFMVGRGSRVTGTVVDTYESSSGPEFDQKMTRAEFY